MVCNVFLIICRKKKLTVQKKTNKFLIILRLTNTSTIHKDTIFKKNCFCLNVRTLDKKINFIELT